MGTPRRARRVGTTIAGLALAWALPASSVEPKPRLGDGRAVMERVDARPRGGDQTARAVWQLIDARGRERVRRTRTFWRDCRPETRGLHAKRLIVFESPPEVKDTAFLVWSHLDPLADDERWIYLPALRKGRRVAGRDRGKSFVGTDFSYDDLSDRNLDEDEHRLLRVEPRDGVEHYVVEAIPRAEQAPYAKRIEFVNAETFTQPRIEYYDRQGLLKVLEAEWQQVDGVWAWKRLEMRHQRNGHRTVVEVSDVRHGTGLPDDLFSESTLRFGVP